MIHVIDTLHAGHPGIIAVTALETAKDGVVLFDTGAEATFDQVANALRELGIELTDVRHVFLSHIHLDHAGAAWRFAERGATIYVHPRGAPHLVDPRRLVESATRIFGDDMGKLWGRIGPIAAGQIRILAERELVRFSSLQLQTIATPGHAAHHQVYYWEDNLFGGDVAGVQLGAGPPVPPFVPPELDVDLWHDSINRMKELNATKLYLPHFGLAKGSGAQHLEALDERIARWSGWFRDRLRSGESDTALRRSFAEYQAAELRVSGATEEQIQAYELADPSYMAVAASRRYWQKHEPVR